MTADPVCLSFFSLILWGLCPSARPHIIIWLSPHTPDGGVPLLTGWGGGRKILTSLFNIIPASLFKLRVLICHFIYVWEAVSPFQNQSVQKTAHVLLKLSMYQSCNEFMS